MQVSCTSKIRRILTRRQPYNGTDFVQNRQQDTAEFMASLMTCIGDDLGEDRSENWSQLLNCSLVEQYRCASNLCGHTSSTVLSYPFFLPVPASGSTSINESLAYQ